MPAMTGRASALKATTAGDHYFTVAGARLRYRDEGRGAALVCVHGWTLGLEMWDAQVAALRDCFRIVRFDRRGHGLSEGISSPERDAADLRALCEHLALRDVALLGMSQGARVAVHALHAGQRVWALILDGPPGLSADAETDIPAERYRSLALEQGMSAFRREWKRHPLTQLRTAEPARRACLEAMLARYSGNDLWAPAAPSPTVQPAPLAVPTLVLSGQFDLPTRIQAADELASLLAAKRAVISGAGHLANLDCPDAYSKCCCDFLMGYVPDCVPVSGVSHA